MLYLMALQCSVFGDTPAEREVVGGTPPHPQNQTAVERCLINHPQLLVESTVRRLERC